MFKRDCDVTKKNKNATVYGDKPNPPQDHASQDTQNCSKEAWCQVTHTLVAHRSRENQDACNLKVEMRCTCSFLLRFSEAMHLIVVSELSTSRPKQN